MIMLSSGNPIRIVSCKCRMVGSLVVCSLTLSQVTDPMDDNVVMAPSVRCCWGVHVSQQIMHVS